MVTYNYMSVIICKFYVGSVKVPYKLPRTQKAFDKYLIREDELRDQRTNA